MIDFKMTAPQEDLSRRIESFIFDKKEGEDLPSKTRSELFAKRAAYERVHLLEGLFSESAIIQRFNASALFPQLLQKEGLEAMRLKMAVIDIPSSLGQILRLE